MKIAVFLDGCFWHGCELHPPSVKKNTDFWLEKISRNRARDARATAHLTELGWTVLRFWEHDTAEEIAGAISSVVSNAKAASPGLRGPLKDVERSSGQFEAVNGNESMIETEFGK